MRRFIYDDGFGISHPIGIVRLHESISQSCLEHHHQKSRKPLKSAMAGADQGNRAIYSRQKRPKRGRCLKKEQDGKGRRMSGDPRIYHQARAMLEKGTRWERKENEWCPPNIPCTQTRASRESSIRICPHGATNRRFPRRVQQAWSFSVVDHNY
eukprot:scaffold12990_cov108-Cylindrotheca_fusiformis.AAC.2